MLGGFPAPGTHWRGAPASSQRGPVQTSTVSAIPQVSFLRLAYGQLRPGTELSGSEARSPVGSLGSKLCCHAFLRGSQPASALLYLARLSHGAVVTTGLQRNVPFHRNAGKEEGP